MQRDVPRRVRVRSALNTEREKARPFISQRKPAAGARTKYSNECQEKFIWDAPRDFDGSLEHSRSGRSEPCFGSRRARRRSPCKAKCPATASISVPALPVVSPSFRSTLVIPSNEVQ